jgi:hypothetical protein
MKTEEEFESFKNRVIMNSLKEEILYDASRIRKNTNIIDNAFYQSFVNETEKSLEKIIENTEHCRFSLLKLKEMVSKLPK